ncbi:MAG: TIGR03663 family protein [Caldilineaceae bacterium]|nr:TIGR03663 family protein [Caldilineaceae bacterium]
MNELTSAEGNSAPLDDERPSVLDRSLFDFLRLDWETVAWLLLLTVAAIARFYDVGTRAMSHDESLHALYSYYLYDAGNYTHNPMMHGPLLFHINTLFYFLFGVTDATARLGPVLAGIAVVGMAWFYRPYLGRLGAFLAGVLLTVSPSLLFHSRYIRNDIYIALFVLIWIYAAFSFLGCPARPSLALGCAAGVGHGAGFRHQRKSLHGRRDHWRVLREPGALAGDPHLFLHCDHSDGRGCWRLSASPGAGEFDLAGCGAGLGRAGGIGALGLFPLAGRVAGVASQPQRGSGCADGHADHALHRALRTPFLWLGSNGICRPSGYRTLGWAGPAVDIGQRGRCLLLVWQEREPRCLARRPCNFNGRGGPGQACACGGQPDLWALGARDGVVLGDPGALLHDFPDQHARRPGQRCGGQPGLLAGPTRSAARQPAHLLLSAVGRSL